MSMENREQVINLLVWFQTYQPQPSPTYLTVFNFDDVDKTYTLKLYNSRMDVHRDGDGFVSDGLWRMVTQNPSQVTAHRLYTLIDHIEKHDPDFKWTLKSLKRAIYYEQYTYAKNQYLKFRTDFENMDELCEEGEKINKEEDKQLHDIMRKQWESPEEKEESAKEKASKLWNLEE